MIWSQQIACGFPQSATSLGLAFSWRNYRPKLSPSLALPEEPCPHAQGWGPKETQNAQGSYLLWVRKLPLAWPEPSQPGVGQVGPSFFSDFQEKGEPLREPSFCLRAASGQPDALLWEAYLPLM